MNFRVVNEKGMISKEMKDAKEVARAVTREAIAMKDDEVILLYLNDDETIRLGKNVLSVHLKDNILEVYNENCDGMCFYDHYDTVRAYVFFNTIKDEVENLIKEYESSEYEQAEAENEQAEYAVSVFGKSLCFTGENAYNSVHDFILAVVSTEDDETGVITVEKDGRGLDIGCAKGKYNIFLRVSDDHCKWEIFEKGDRIAISKFLREWVIL